MNYLEAFGVEPIGQVKVEFFLKDAGLNERGHRVFNVSERQNGTETFKYDILYHRSKSIDEIDFDKAGADGYGKAKNVGITGAWLWLRDGAVMDTTGYGKTIG